jgi:hypothetical protein
MHGLWRRQIPSISAFSSPHAVPPADLSMKKPTFVEGINRSIHKWPHEAEDGKRIADEAEREHCCVGAVFQVLRINPKLGCNKKKTPAKMCAKRCRRNVS